VLYSNTGNQVFSRQSSHTILQQSTESVNSFSSYTHIYYMR